MSAPVDDFDLDIRLSTVEAVVSGDAVAVATEVKSACQTYCFSACTTGCRASDCVCNN